MDKFEQPNSIESKEKIPLDSNLYPILNEQLQHRYDQIAKKWNGEAYDNTRRDDLISTLIKAAEIKENDIVLEAMCGTALVAQKIKDIFPMVRVCGLDFSLGMINEIPTGEIVRVQSSILATPFPDETFDKILLRSAIYDLPKRMQRNALQEISRIMNKDSVFILQTYITEQNSQGVLNDIANMKDRLAGQYQDMGGESPRYFATKKEFEEWFKKIGLNFELVQDFSSDIKLQKASEMPESAKKMFSDFMTNLSKEHQEAIKLRFDEKEGYTYNLPGVIFKLKKY